MAELISKLNFLDDEDHDTPPGSGSNPFEDPDDYPQDPGDSLEPPDLNPFGEPEDEGRTSAHEPVDLCSARVCICSNAV